MLKKVFVAIVVAACGGATQDTPTQPNVHTGASAREMPTASASATIAPPTPSAFVGAPDAPPPQNRPTLAQLTDAGRVAKWFGSPKIPVAQRNKTLADLSAKWNELASQPRAQRSAAAVAWLKARPEIDDAGATSINVWGRFKDGKLIIAPTYSWALKTPKHARLTTHASSSNAKEIPEQRADKAMDLFGAGVTDEIGGWLKNHGYNEAASAPTVKDLKTVKQAGAFAITTHGGIGYQRKDNATNQDDFNELYALMTSDPVLDANGVTIDARRSVVTAPNNVPWRAMNEDSRAKSADYEADLDSGKLVYFLGDPGDGSTSAFHYGITRLFVAAYMTFSKDAVIFLNACSSFSYDEKAPDMWLTFENLNPAVLLGWTNEAEPEAAWRAEEFLFARMLGEIPTLGEGGKPPQRPWEFSYAYADLRSKGYDQTMLRIDRGVPAPVAAQLKYWTENAHVMLVPSIKYMELDEIKKELTLHGDFGPEPADKDRHVTIGAANVDCPIKDWGDDKITCTVPETGDGPVVVTKRGRKSNAAPLTEWLLKVLHKSELQIPGQFGSGIQFEAHVRADVHKYRENPQDAPKERDPIPFYVSHDSKCGSGGAQGNFVGAHGRAWMTNGAAQIPVAFERPSGGAFCTMYGEIDPQNKQLKLAVFAIAKRGVGNFGSTAGGASFGGAVIPVPGLFDGSVHPPPGVNAPAMPTAIFFSLDDKGNIAAGKKGPVTLPQSSKVQASLEWDASQPTGYPTDDTPQ